MCGLRPQRHTSDRPAPEELSSPPRRLTEKLPDNRTRQKRFMQRNGQKVTGTRQQKGVSHKHNKCFMLRERGQTEEATGFAIPLARYSYKGKALGRSQIPDCQGLGVKGGSDYKGVCRNMGATWFCLDCGGGYMTVYIQQIYLSKFTCCRVKVSNLSRGHPEKRGIVLGHIRSTNTNDS